MSKVKLLLLACLFLTGLTKANGQSYRLQYVIVDKDSINLLQLQDSFPSRLEANAYVASLPGLLQTKGFITSSVDSIKLDSLQGYVQLFLGQPYRWARIATRPADADILEAIHWPATSFKNTGLEWSGFQAWQETALSYLENNGHPFAKVYLDSISINEKEVDALLSIDRGPAYKIDSIVVFGNAKISREFLQQYLDLPNGAVYSKKKLLDAEKKIKELTYVEEEKPLSLSMHSSGSVVNLYLKPKRSSQMNALVGFLPNSNPNDSKKFLVTGEANILLRNSLGAGETIGLNWQQLQVKSPRLNILYDHPFLFRSPLGLNFTFDMFRKDSTFLNIIMQIGGRYVISGSQSALIFLQRRQSILNGVDTFRIKQLKQLPGEADVSSTNLGVTYNFNNTNYRFNPQKGSELNITVAAGTKKVKKNNQVMEINDPSFNYKGLYDTVKLSTYQFRLTASAARYFKTGKQTALKTAINAGAFQSGSYYINELFQIGGYKLLRGFTEESEYVSQYMIGTVEYRYLIGVNSNFFAFIDGGWGKNPIQTLSSRSYIGTGLGLSLETKAGIFNLAWAVGKRNDTELNLRQSKIHFGFVNYF